jgi:hypothetical protein
MAGAYPHSELWNSIPRVERIPHSELWNRVPRVERVLYSRVSSGNGSAPAL